MARLTAVRCVGEIGMNILKFVQRSSTVLTKQLDTKSCPIFEKCLNIEVSPEEEKRCPVVGGTKADLPRATDRLMGNSEPNTIMYLHWNEVNDPKFDDQIGKHLYHLVEAGKIGYLNNAQSICLNKN